MIPHAFVECQVWEMGKERTYMQKDNCSPPTPNPPHLTHPHPVKLPHQLAYSRWSSVFAKLENWLQTAASPTLG